MKSKLSFFLALTAVLALAAGFAAAQKDELESVLTSMDRAAANFRNAQADFVWEQYQLVVDETDVQKGTVYFRRDNGEIQMSAHITEPDRKFVLFSEGKVRVYQPRIEQVTEYEAGKNREEVESFLVLGFGGRGHDLLKSFEVRFAGYEPVEGVRTAKLELTPKSQRARGMFEQIILWIDPQRGLSLRQQFLEPSGDHRTTRYSNIQVNHRLPDDVFRLKTTGKTKFIRPQG